MNSGLNTKKFNDIKDIYKKEGYMIDFSSDDEFFGKKYFRKIDMKISKITMIIESNKNRIRDKYKRKIKRNFGFVNRNRMDDLIEDRLRYSKKLNYDKVIKINETNFNKHLS
jgi:hypothetical protein